VVEVQYLLLTELSSGSFDSLMVAADILLTWVAFEICLLFPVVKIWAILVDMITLTSPAIQMNFIRAFLLNFDPINLQPKQLIYILIFLEHS